MPHSAHLREQVVVGLGDGFIEFRLLAFHLGAHRFADGPEGPRTLEYDPPIVTTVIQEIVRPTS